MILHHQLSIARPTATMPGPYEASLRANALGIRSRLNPPQQKPAARLLVPSPLPEPAGATLPQAAPAWRRILVEVADKHRLTVDIILSKTRKKHIVHARWECAYRMVVEVGMSFTGAARRLGLDHTSCMYAVRQHVKIHADLMPEWSDYLEANSSPSSSIHREVTLLYFKEGWKVRGIATEVAITPEEVQAIINAELRTMRLRGAGERKQ